jgi:hypothetical protein
LQFDSGPAPAAKTPLSLPNGLALTYGQILALGGDFYGLPNAPISDDPNPPARFNQAFNSLAVQASSVAEATEILKIMQIEIDAVNKAIADHEQPSKVYARLGDSLSAKSNVVTGGGSSVSDWVPLGRYLELAATNWDHFGTYAVTAYTTGHGVAMQQAITAGKIQRQVQLELAYAMDAFACHFLSDLFSSGHMRTPRKELYETVTPSYVGSYLARYMHDEDCCWGLNVQNQQTQQWKAYGDKCQSARSSRCIRPRRPTIPARPSPIFRTFSSFPTGSSMTTSPPYSSLTTGRRNGARMSAIATTMRGRPTGGAGRRYRCSRRSTNSRSAATTRSRPSLTQRSSSCGTTAGRLG